MHMLKMFMLAALTVTLLGCGSAEDAPPGADVDVVPPCVADPAQAQPEDRCGVFVSSTLGSDDAPGTRDGPVRSIATAITLAQAGPRRVYACAERFVDPVEVPSGIELWGGLDCADAWTYVGGATKTTIATEPGAIPLRFVPGDGATVAADLRAEAASAAEPSGSSIAALVMPNAAVEIRRSELVAGVGAAGTPGEQGGGPGASWFAQQGADGLPGGGACIADFVAGGIPVATVCDGVESSLGGRGGDAHVTYGEDGEDGQPVPENPDGTHGLGGHGQNGTYTMCFGGHNGHGGQDGEHGLGAVGPGRITAFGWAGEKGQDGGNGLPGQGGGGGGGVRGPLWDACGTNQPQGGASGGAGGSGGCGGKGAKGGGYGGASIGLVQLSGDVALRGVTITTGNGGDGGRGGPWQVGGLGGLGAPGGAPSSGSLGGCKGAVGGPGGNGGNGGGGLGGPSIGVAYLDGHSVSHENIIITTGTPGEGGPGGSTTLVLPGTTGADGIRADVMSFAAR